jgi:hypothetical protein
MLLELRRTVCEGEGRYILEGNAQRHQMLSDTALHARPRKTTTMLNQYVSVNSGTLSNSGLPPPGERVCSYRDRLDFKLNK